MINLPKLLNDSGAEIRRLHPVSLSITEQAVPLSTATMKLPKGESVSDRSYLELFTPNGSAGIYRSRTPSKGFGKFSNDYNLEHAICEVGDWLVRANIEQTQKTLAQAISQVFGYYGGSKWQLGTVSASGNVILTANYSNVLQTINSLISQVTGAVMTFDFTTSPWTFNVVSLSNTVTAEGRLSRNITSAQIKKDDKDLCTRVWIKGTKYDADTIVTYGVIEKNITDKNYTSTQAATVANSYLEKYKNPIYSITIDGMDFSSLTGETLDEVKIGKLYRLVIPEDGVSLNQYVTTVSWKDVYNTPNAVAITLSESNKTLVDFVQKQASDLYGADGYYNYQLSEKDKIWSKFSVTDQAITAEVGRATEAEGTLQSNINVQAGRIDLVVTGTGANAEVNAGSIVLGLNAQDPTAQSFVKISADMVDIDGSLVVSNLEQEFEDLTDGSLWADRISTESIWTYALHVVDPVPGQQTSTMEIFGQNVGYVDLTIDGNQYRLLMLATI